MPAISGGPGKTAPKLVNDFLRFDPLKADSSASFLTKVTPPVGEGQQLQPNVRSCQHEYATKHSQSVVPPLDVGSAGGSRYKLAVCCKKCRVHADVRIAYYDVATNPCPNSRDPLHHFIRREDVDSTGLERIQYGWQCSAESCQAQVTISYSRPRISEEERIALTDTERLKRAYESMLKDNPAREGLKQATPVDVLSRLRRYVKDSLKPDQVRRSFPADNKRFGEAFGLYGRDFNPLLGRLGFQFVEAQGENEAVWHLPNPSPLEDRLNAQGTSQRELLEDVETEFRALLFKVAGETGLVNPAASEGWPSADRDVDRTLAAQGYPRFSSLRRQVAPSEELPYFASLGLQPDFADNLVIWAFDKQLQTDPARQSYYYECLQVIAEFRKTEDLQTKVVLLESGGLVSRRDLKAAYRYLDISERDGINSDDERILNLFYVRTSDSGPEAKIEARTALKKIGQARGSKRLLRAAEQTIETYEEAIDWIGNGATKTTDDEFLIVLAATKMEENEELTRTAMAVIAKERKSDSINSWLLNASGDGISLEEALRHCQITEAWSNIADKSSLTIWFGMARLDSPGELTEKAIAVIERAMQAEASSSHSLETWPVGLTSHGNTCYLNSLLQYYFSIKPLRDIVLNYDKYELDTEQHATKDERVGNRKISTEEVKGGQRFAKDLKQLFERMIKSRDEHVRPEDDLVCRAFLEMKDYALLASTVREAKAEHETNTNGVLGHIEEETADEINKLSAPSGLEHLESNASSVTLQGDEDVPMQNGELPPTPPQSPRKEDLPELTVAPPLPPRRFSTTREHALEKAQEKAKAQQDVTEVHDDVLFKLRAGMMPEGMDSSGEQEDQLRRLFRYSMIETSVKSGIDGKKKELLDMAIMIPPPSEATDIYTMLDRVFDLQSVGETTEAGILEGYKSLHHLPSLLQINIARIDYDKEKGSFKSEACVKLEDELYLDRYVDMYHPQVLPKRKDCWQWRQQLHSLRKERKALQDTPQITDKPKDLDGVLTCGEAGQYLAKLSDVNDDLVSIGIEGLDVPPNLINAIMTDTSAQMERLVNLDFEIASIEHQLKDQFSEFKDIKYRLSAVFFHRGSYGHGHYWIYIHDFEHNVWRLYNDEKVEEFKNVNDILEATTWQHGTPTFAVYVRDDQKTDIIQPVCRSPETVPEPQQPVSDQTTTDHDIEMENMDTTNGTVDPRNTLVEHNGTQESSGGWDAKRSVAPAKW